MAGSWMSTSLKGFSWAKVVKPFSPTAGVVVTMMLSEACVLFALALMSIVVPLGTLVMIVPAGIAPAESVTASLAKKPVLLLTSTVLLFLVVDPVTVDVIAVRQGGPGVIEAGAAVVEGLGRAAGRGQVATR